MTNLISNNKRDFVAEAQAVGSKATTIKGALRALINNRPSKITPFYKVNPYFLPSPTAYKNAEAERKAYPDAKRAHADKSFRKNFLARLRREEKRLIKSPGNVDAAYARLKEIAKERAIATGKDIQPIPARQWTTSTEAKKMAFDIAMAAGCDHDTGSSWDRGDYYTTSVRDVVYGERLAWFHATGRILAVVEESRKRVYAKSSKWYPSYRSDFFLVGRNENGNAFAHALPHRDDWTVASAVDWIWNGAEIIARQGDIAITPSALKNKIGEEMQITVGDGHSRHIFIGEVYVNGSTHIRSGFLVHTGNQHPPVYVDGQAWRRIVVARRSERTSSTAD